MRHDFVMLHMIQVLDGYVMFQSPSTERLSRWVLEQLRAKNPDLSASSEIRWDADKSVETVAFRTFDDYIMETLKTLALFEEQEWVGREERAAFGRSCSSSSSSWSSSSNSTRRDNMKRRDKIDPKGAGAE